MTMNPFEQSRQQLLHYLTSNAEQEVIDYIRQEMQHDAPDSIPTEEELFAFFQSPDEPTELDAYQQMLATDKLLEYAEISLRTVCDLIRYQQLKELGVVHSPRKETRPLTSPCFGLPRTALPHTSATASTAYCALPTAPAASSPRASANRRTTR